MKTTLDRYEVTALQKMGWKEEEIALLYPFLIPQFKDFDHEEFRRLTRLESMEGRSEDTCFELQAERIEYADAFRKNPFKYCIRICPSMEEAFVKAGARLLPGSQVKFLYERNATDFAESIFSERVIDLLPDDVPENEVFPNKGAWFRVAVFNDMDIYRNAVDIIEKEFGNGHKKLKDSLDYILWLDEMVAKHEIHYLFEEWYIKGLKCLGEIMEKDFDVAMELAYIFHHHVTRCDNVDEIGIVEYNPDIDVEDYELSRIWQKIVVNEIDEDWRPSCDAHDRYTRMSNIIFKTFNACNPIPEGVIPDEVNSFELSGGGITLRTWRDGLHKWKNSHGLMLDWSYSVTYEELARCMIADYLTREYLAEHRAEVIQSMALVTAKVESMDKKLIECAGSEPKVKRTILSLAEGFYYEILPFMHFDAEEVFGLPYFSPSVSSKIFHKNE